MFHELSSEPVFAAAFALWALLVVRAAFAPSVGRFALVGLGVALLALVRPGNAVLLAFAIVPLARRGHVARRVRCGRRHSPSPPLVPLAAWSVHNGVRFDSWAARARRQRDRPLLPRVHHRPHHLARERRGLTPARCGDAAAPPDARAVPLVRRHARRALREGELPRARGPLPPLRPGLRLGLRLRRPPRAPASRACAPIPASTPAAWRGRCGTSSSKAQFRVVSATGGRQRRARQAATVVIHGKRLPAPTEGEPIPAGQVVWISRPDNSIRQVWTSPTEWHFEFDAPRAARRASSEIEREDGRPLRRAPRPRRERAARAPPQPALALVPAARGCGSSLGLIAIACVDRAGGRSLVALVARRVRRRAPERARPLRRPPLRAARGAGVRAPRPRRAPRDPRPEDSDATDTDENDDPVVNLVMGLWLTRGDI